MSEEGRGCDVAARLRRRIDFRIYREIEGRRLVADGTVAADGDATLSVTELREALRDEFAGFDAFRDGIEVVFGDDARLHVSYDPCRFCAAFDAWAA